MSPEAERLSDRLEEWVGQTQEIARAIVSELGITPEMVSVLAGDRGINPGRSIVSITWDAADALAVLLEVAGVQTEVDDE